MKRSRRHLLERFCRSLFAAHRRKGIIKNKNREVKGEEWGYYKPTNNKREIGKDYFLYRLTGIDAGLSTTTKSSST